MTVTWCGRGLLKRVREVVLVKGHLIYPHLSNTATCLSLTSSYNIQTRNYTFLSLLLHHQPCSSIHPLLTCHSTTTITTTSFSTSSVFLKVPSKVTPAAVPNEKPRDARQQQIALIDSQDKVSWMTLEAASKLAKRQDLKLVKVDDPSQGKNVKVYKMLTGKQYFEHQMKAKDGKKSIPSEKGEKNLVVRGKISVHDLEIKLNNLNKWLSKGHRIKVSITSAKATQEEVEKVFSIIEKEAKKLNGRILQRQEKMDDIRFYIAPLKKENEDSNSETKQDENQTLTQEASHHTKDEVS